MNELDKIKHLITIDDMDFKSMRNSIFKINYSHQYNADNFAEIFANFALYASKFKEPLWRKEVVNLFTELSLAWEKRALEIMSIKNIFYKMFHNSINISGINSPRRKAFYNYLNKRTST